MKDPYLVFYLVCHLASYPTPARTHTPRLSCSELYILTASLMQYVEFALYPSMLRCGLGVWVISVRLSVRACVRACLLACVRACVLARPRTSDTRARPRPVCVCVCARAACHGAQSTRKVLTCDAIHNSTYRRTSLASW